MASEGVLKVVIFSCYICIVFTQRFERIDRDITSVSEVTIPVDTVTVVLTSNQITTLNDGDFQDLTECKSLHLGDNKIRTIHDEAFKGLSKLQYLYLHFNELTEFPNLMDLPELTELIIYGNQFRFHLTESVPVLPNNKIEVLNMGHMEIISVKKEFLLNFPKLLDLDVCCNTLIDTPPIDVISDHLLYLDISSNNIPSLGPSSFKSSKPSVLKVFKYESVEIGKIVFAELNLFRELPTLEEVYLGSWGLNKLPDFNGNIEVLEKLEIQNNPALEELDPEQLFGSPPNYSHPIAMKELVLSNNGLKYLSGEFFAAMTKLKVLNLIGNKLSVFPMEKLENLQYLQSVALERNELSTLCDIGHRDRSGLKIEIAGNPLVCDIKLCWLFDSGYIYYSPERLGKQFSRYPCVQPNNLVSTKWPDFSGDDVGCTGSSEPYGCTTPVLTPPDQNLEDEPEAQKSEDESELPLIPIVAGVVGGLILILCIIIGIMIKKRKSQEKNAEGNNETTLPPPVPPTTSNTNTKNNFSDPTEIYITPGQGSKPRETSSLPNRSSDHTYAEIQNRDSRMVRELGDVNEIGLQASFYNHSNVVSQ